MLDKLKAIFKEVRPGIDITTVTEDSRLVEDLKLDSLSQLMVSMKMEEVFGIHFDKPVVFKTVKDVLDYLEKEVK
ncbi:MAG: hypothetical protein IKX23_01155 [Treponema sp.]|nr:hypothetical protein [Treponema sp.]